MGRTEMTKIILCLMALLILFPSRAYAYIDPGMGSMMVQFIWGLVIGSFLLFRKRLGEFLNKIKYFFKREK